MEQLSAAAQCFAVQLDLRDLFTEIALHGSTIVPSGQVTVYSCSDGRVSVESGVPTTPAGSSDTVSEEVRWCVRYLKPKTRNMPVDDPDAARSILCVPLVASQNRVLGVIEFRNRKTGGVFTEHDVRAAWCLARLATTAVDRARLFFRIEEWKQSIETLLSFNATINQHLEPEEMVRRLVMNVTGFLDAEGGMAGLAIGSGPHAELQCDGFWCAGLWTDFRRTWRRGEGIPGTVMETQFPFLSRDYRKDPLRESDLCRSFDLGSAICVPIKNPQEEVLGFFQLHRRSGEPEFTWQDAAFLETLGNTAAVAIENARLMRSLKLKTEKIRSLSQDHLRRLEQERRHIARELHDETGQVLIGLKLRLQILSGLLTDDQSEAREQLAELRTVVNAAAVSLRDLARKLRPPTLDDLDLEAAVRQLVTDMCSHAPFRVSVAVQSGLVRSESEQTALYRIIQEGLTNIMKHAHASRVTISFSGGTRRRCLRIEDDGVGFDPDEATGGLGLVGMKERVSMLGGRFRVASAAGSGTILEVILAGEEPG